MGSKAEFCLGRCSADREPQAKGFEESQLGGAGSSTRGAVGLRLGTKGGKNTLTTIQHPVELRHPLNTHICTHAVLKIVSSSPKLEHKSPAGHCQPQRTPAAAQGSTLWCC